MKCEKWHMPAPSLPSKNFPFAPYPSYSCNIHQLDASGDDELNNYKLRMVEPQMEEVWVPEFQHGAESLIHHDNHFRLDFNIGEN